MSDPNYVDIFQPAITFVKENHFYSVIVPILKKLQDISNVPENERNNSFIRYYGSRISLNPGNFQLQLKLNRFDLI